MSKISLLCITKLKKFNATLINYEKITLKSFSSFCDSNLIGCSSIARGEMLDKEQLKEFIVFGAIAMDVIRLEANNLKHATIMVRLEAKRLKLGFN